LDTAVFLSVRNTILFLMKKNQRIYPDTFYMYNDLLVATKQK
jgi:HD superfamily phosphohydrolase YqeK